MTVGNISSDVYNTVTTSCHTSDKIRRRRTKVWSGTDTPKVDPVYVVLKNPENGKYYRKRVRIKRKKEPNAYSMTSSHKNRSYITAMRPNNAMNCAAGFSPWSQAELCWFAHTTFGADPFTANDQIKLLAKLHDKIWGSSFNPSVFLAEAGSGLNMITSAATRLTRSIYFARKGDYARAWKTLGSNPRYVPPSTKKSMANIWAEFRWGWTPLISDAYDGAVWAAHLLNAPIVFRFAVRREMVNVLKDSYINSPYSVGPHAGFGAHSHRRQLIAYLEEPPHNAVLDAINPASVAWELVPYSFVFDWFIPISTWLQVRGLGSTLRGKFVTTDLIRKETGGLVIDNFNPTAVYKCKWRSSTGDFAYENSDSYFTMSRTISTSLDIPKPVFKGFGKVATWKHAADSVALLIQSRSLFDKKS